LAALNIAESGSAENLEKNIEITIVEEHASAGFPVQCGGLISEDCFIKLRRFVSDRSRLNNIKGAFFFSPDGNYVEAVGRSGAVVVERKVLDTELLMAASEYSEIRVKTKLVSFNGEKARLEGVKTEYLSYDVLIGADGVASTVAKLAAFPHPSYFSAVQMEIAFEPLDERFVELYFGRSYSDGFFAYSIPVDCDTARIGVVSKQNPEYYLKNLITKHPSVSERVKRKITELNAGAIPVGLIDFVKGNIALIGDAAGMVKPYTGGGIYYHLIAAERLGKHFPNLEEYQKSYKKELGKEYDVGIKIAKLYSLLDDEDYNYLVKVGKEIDFSELHMDRPSGVLNLVPSILKIASKPSLIKKMARAFFRSFKSSYP
jgi:flavin-dependent dehydrogenase